MRCYKLAAFTAIALALSAPPLLAQDTQQPAGGHGKAEFLRTYDSDLDGVVSRAEFDARRGDDYARTDADRNGTLTEEEYVGDYTRRLDAELAETRQRQLAQAHVRFGVLNTDRSAEMSRDEFNASGGRIFSRLDTNGDGRVDDADTADHF